MGIQKGTKLTDTPKSNTLKFRYDSETQKRLEEIQRITGKTKSEIIREGIDNVYAEITKK